MMMVLLFGVANRVRLVGALTRAGHRVGPAQRPTAWPAGWHPPVLITDDSAAAARVRARITATAPGTTCVVLVDDPTVARYRQLLASGATALPATSTDDDVVLGVTAASRALACVPATVARALAGASADRPPLTDREASWLRALANGATVASLARAVGYSQREMYRVLGGLYTRLGAANRTEALLRADRWGLLTPAGRT